MWGDEVLEQVRAAREAIAARFNYDMEAMVADLQRREASSGHPLIMPPEAVDAEPDGSQRPVPNKSATLVI